MSLDRRALLQGIAALSLPCAFSSSIFALAGCTPTPKIHQKVNWNDANRIIAAIPELSFPEQTFDIREFGAKPGEDCSAAIAKTIEACSNAGGGKVLIDGGNYHCGPIHLKSNINLHINEGAVLKFSNNPKDYLPAVLTRWEGVEHMGYSPLVYAYGQENIAISGKGTLDGQADATHWWAWKGNKTWGIDGYPSQKASRDQLFADAEAGIPPEKRMYAEGHYLRPPFIQPYLCKNIVIRDITIVSAPFWLINPVLCENVKVQGVHLESLGPNSDGCDPESCKNVLIEDCYFDTGDDCIAIKSGRNNDGRRIGVPTENIVIRNCKMRAGHGGVVIGSEISGGVRNVFADNNEMSSPDLDRGFRIKTNSVRGGVLENIFMRNTKIGQVRDAIVINFHYEEGDAGQFDPLVRNVQIENIDCLNAEQVFKVRGFKRAPIEGLSVTHAAFHKARKNGVLEHVNDLHLEDIMINGETFSAGG
ncbi:Endopolygalacturonase [Alteromonadaceae bacterium Bs31]|nr:Endopolygalacturonase [Alteromonadaceae bacterium Bs31]